MSWRIRVTKAISSKTLRIGRLLSPRGIQVDGKNTEPEYPPVDVSHFTDGKARHWVGFDDDTSMFPHASIRQLWVAGSLP